MDLQSNNPSDSAPQQASVPDGLLESTNSRPAALTLKADRLAGSNACLNCGTRLQGAYCDFCGQPDKHLKRPFPVMLAELMEDLFDLDSRFARTIKPLLFMPGKLTQDYLQGMRFRYTPPLRLYIFTSMAFFVVAALISASNIEISLPADDVDTEISEVDIRINDQPWNRETNPVAIPMVPDAVNRWINNEIAQSPRRIQALKADPSLLVDTIFEVMPQAMFLLLPVVALILKLWYLFASRLYFEHLIFSLHNHAFAYLTLLIIISLESGALWLDPTESGRTYRVVEGLTVIMLTWVPIYMLLAMKRVYGQGWIMTVCKFLLVSLSYWTVLMLALFVAAFIGFVNL